MKNSGEIIQKPTRMRRMSESLCKHRIVIDMSYYNLMKDKVIITLYTRGGKHYGMLDTSSMLAKFQ